jgi:DNA (cytosine-5)-methyltransferase 1
MRLLDLFCGAGGAAMGYHRAGFEVVGVDVRPQPHYPFEFHQADALTYSLDGFDVVHASPPCQRWSALNNGTWGNARGHADLIGPVRERLIGLGVPYVIENVPGAPLRDPVLLCGSMFGLRIDGVGYLRRHRLFESNVPVAGGTCLHVGQALGVYGHGRGGGPLKGRSLAAADARTIMEIYWATRDGVAQAIPPAYTEHIGKSIQVALMNSWYA